MQIKSLSYANFVRDYRLRAGLSQEQLAAKVGLSCNSVSLIENGASCSDISAMKISVALDIPFDLVFWLVDLSNGEFLVAWRCD